MNTTETRQARPCDCADWRVDIDTAEILEAFRAAASRKVRDMIDPADWDDAGWKYATPTCGSMTTRRFAPGHDARVKGLLQAAYRSGATVTYVGEGMAVSSDPINLASQHLPGMVGAIEALPMPRKASPRKAKAEKAATPRVQIKIGRWAYDAVIDPITEEATYTTRDGAVLKSFNYTVV